MTMKDLRFGIIGWGYWGPKIARNLEALSHVMITMVVDSDTRRLASLPANLYQGIIKKTDNIKDVLQSDVDGIVIATPVKTHYRLAKEALLYGKHVLVEKPLTTSIAEAEELIELARERNLTLMVGHTFEYSPAINELRKFIQSGELGNIYSIEAERLNLGLFRSDVNVIWDLAPHDISILLYLLGKKPEQMKVQAYDHLQPGIHDIAHLDLEFADKMTAHIHVSWLHPCKVRRITVIGDARMAIYDDTDPAEMLKIYNKGADIHADPVVSYRFGAITIPHIDWVEPLRLECEDFVNSIRTGDRPRADGYSGLEVVRILSAAQEILTLETRQSIKVAL